LIGALKTKPILIYMLKHFAPPCIASAVALLSLSARAAVFNESVSGDLSNNQAAPAVLTLDNGGNSVVGTVNGTGDSQDWIALTVPNGLQLSSVTLAAYTSSDGQGFTGVQSGSSFVGSPFVASSYLGYAHYGTAADNGSQFGQNLIGVNILPIMGDNTIATGSQGFTPPLGAGTYTFLIQQLGAATSYQFDYAVTPVPEPASQAAVAGIVCAAFFLKRRFAR
jgi:hypothetical protein